MRTKKKSERVCVCVATEGRSREILYIDMKKSGTWFSSIKEVGMVAALPQLHEYVEQLHLGHLPSPIHNINVLQKDLSVPVASDGGLHIHTCTSTQL